MSLLVLTLLAAAPQPDCERAATQPEFNACALAAFRHADAALNRQWAATLQAVRSQDDAPRAARLRAAQRAWSAFRDAHCDSAHFGTIGASLDYTLNIYCRTRLTEERTRQLADFAMEH
ncbi:MAG TPA: lysozyme inhibitor LprI family protein [Allosphingosinicella sp.]